MNCHIDGMVSPPRTSSSHLSCGVVCQTGCNSSLDSMILSVALPYPGFSLVVTSCKIFGGQQRCCIASEIKHNFLGLFANNFKVATVRLF